ncbi:MAG: lipid A deacylase LpxR family protein [Bacteroidota bacterium]
MFRYPALWMILMLLMVFSCSRPEAVVPDADIPASGQSDFEMTFNSPVIVFVYPDHKQAESLKKEAGTDYFYKLSDKSGTEFAKARNLAERYKLATWSGTTAKYRFVTRDGTVVDMDLSRTSQPWKLIIFNGSDAPVLANPEEARTVITLAFHLKQRPDGKTNGIDKSDQLPSGNQNFHLAESNQVIDSLPGLKETTIRLLILPGQAPPPIRDKTEGIRIVNSYISPHRRFWIEFDNDMFSNTDRYYTNGVVIGYTAPALTSWRLNRLMIGRNRNSVVHSAISLHHGMFTPLTTREPPPLVYDRPYASTLYLRYCQVSEDEQAGVRQTCAIEAGVIGDAALGQLLQRSVHAGLPSNDEPQGWETQIRNDLVLNYNLDVQKQLVKSGHTEIYAEGSVIAGTLHTRACMGIHAITGNFVPGLTPLPENFSGLLQKGKNWQYGLRAGLEVRMVAYDASLQGGLFNRNNIFALKPDEIERLVAAMHVGLFAAYKKVGLSLSQFYLSPEFNSGKQHFWGQVGLDFGW